MSLYVYDKYDIDSGLIKEDDVIRKVSEFFDLNVVLHDNVTNRKLIEVIDNGKYVNENYYSSSMLECGLVLKSKLSCGCKTCISINEHPDKCFDLITCGMNAIIQALQIPNGRVFLRPSWVIGINNLRCDIVYKDIHFDKLLVFYNWRAEHGFSR